MAATSHWGLCGLGGRVWLPGLRGVWDVGCALGAEILNGRPVMLKIVSLDL